MHQALKVELPGELQASRRIGGSDSPEIGVAQVGVRHEEVRMVEGVKEFCTERQIYSFLDKCILQKCDLSIIQAQRGEEPMAGDS